MLGHNSLTLHFQSLMNDVTSPFPANSYSAFKTQPKCPLLSEVFLTSLGSLSYSSLYQQSLIHNRVLASMPLDLAFLLASPNVLLSLLFRIFFVY